MVEKVSYPCRTDRTPWRGMDFFRDGFATVRRGNLPSGKGSDERMNTMLEDFKYIPGVELPPLVSSKF